MRKAIVFIAMLALFAGCASPSQTPEQRAYGSSGEQDCLHHATLPICEFADVG